MNLIDVGRDLGTEEQCLAYLEAIRWPAGVTCLRCGGSKVSKSVSTVKSRKTGEVKKTRHLYDCLSPECRHQFSATTGTIFHDTHLPLTKWFMALAIICSAKKSVSALQMTRHLKVAYRTAWHLMHRLRQAMEPGQGGLLTGGVEVDSTRIGGRFDKRRARGRYELPVVFGLVERGEDGKPSKVRAFPIPRESSIFVGGAIRKHVSPRAKALYTDQFMGYRSVGKEFNRQAVNHIAGEYARGNVHVNNIEGFWSLFKRGIQGSWHHISEKHLTRYLNEFTYRQNGREHPDLFKHTAWRAARGERLPYRKLVSD
jgi:transposase-like protein